MKKEGKIEYARVDDWYEVVELGLKGWELVSVLPAPQKADYRCTYFLKRKIK